MAAGIKELDQVALGSNTGAWHEQGIVVAGTMTAKDAMELANMAYGIGMERLCLPDGRGGFIESDVYCTVRDDLELTDSRRILGTGLSSRYEPIPNVECFGIGDFMLGDGAQYETAGTLQNGRLAWIMAKLSGQTVVGNDVVEQYLLISTSHDGSRAMQIMFTPVRVVCQNTLNWAIGGASNVATVRHTKNKNAQIADAKRVLGLAGEYFEQHEQVMVSMSQKAIDDRFAAAFLTALIPDPPPNSGKNGKDKKWSSASGKRRRIMELWKKDQAGADSVECRGTAYGLMNAVAEHTDHERTVLAMNGRAKSDARMQSVVYGTGADFKQTAVSAMTRYLEVGEVEEEKESASAVDNILAGIDLNLQPGSEAVDDILAGIDLN